MIPQNNLKKRGSPSAQNENRAQLSARRDRPSAPSQSRARQAPQGAGSGILQPREGAPRRRNGANPNISSEKVHSSAWLQQVELEGSSLRAYRHRPPPRAGTRGPARRTETRGARRLRRWCHCVPAQLCSSPRSSRSWCRLSTARFAWGRPGSGFSSGRDWKPPLWKLSILLAASLATAWAGGQLDPPDAAWFPSQTGLFSVPAISPHPPPSPNSRLILTSPRTGTAGCPGAPRPADGAAAGRCRLLTSHSAAPPSPPLPGRWAGSQTEAARRGERCDGGRAGRRVGPPHAQGPLGAVVRVAPRCGGARGPPGAASAPRAGAALPAGTTCPGMPRGAGGAGAAAAAGA